MRKRRAFWAKYRRAAKLLAADTDAGGTSVSIEDIMSSSDSECKEVSMWTVEGQFLCAVFDD
jgi:hypothetical protein